MAKSWKVSGQDFQSETNEGLLLWYSKAKSGECIEGPRNRSSRRSRCGMVTLDLLRRDCVAGSCYRVLSCQGEVDWKGYCDVLSSYCHLWYPGLVYLILVYLMYDPSLCLFQGSVLGSFAFAVFGWLMGSLGHDAGHFAASHRYPQLNPNYHSSQWKPYSYSPIASFWTSPFCDTEE